MFDATVNIRVRGIKSFESNKLYRNSWPPLSAAISSRKQQRNKFLSSHRSLVLLCSPQGKIVRDGRFKSICEVKTFWCLRSCPARTIACEQALIFVVIKDVARAAKPRVTSRRAQRAGERSGTRNESLQGRHCFFRQRVRPRT